MARTLISSDDIASSAIVRAALNTSLSGSAVIAKLISGTGLTLSSFTGADSGTGDVTVAGGTLLDANLQFTFAGANAVLQTGIWGDFVVPFGCTITSWTLLALQSGAIVIDIWKQSYASFPPTVTQTITGSALPTIAATNAKGQSSTLTGWTTALAKGDILRFNINSVTTIQQVVLALQVTRT